MTYLNINAKRRAGMFINPVNGIYDHLEVEDPLPAPRLCKLLTRSIYSQYLFNSQRTRHLRSLCAGKGAQEGLPSPSRPRIKHINNLKWCFSGNPRFQTGNNLGKRSPTWQRNEFRISTRTKPQAPMRCH